MMSIPYLPLFVTDYEADTVHLSVAEDGAYMRLLRLQWRTPGCSMPNDKAWIQRRVRASDEEWEAIYQPILDEFFIRNRGRIYQHRLMREWQRIKATSAKRSSAGQKGGRPRKVLKTKETDKSPAKANEKHLDLDLDIKKKTTSSPPIVPHEAFEKFWAVYPQRKGRKEAVKAFERAVKSGVEPEKIIIGAERYAAWLEAMGDNAPTMKYPQGWINGERWKDELHVPQPKKPQTRGERQDDTVRRLMERASTIDGGTPNAGMAGQHGGLLTDDLRQAGGGGRSRGRSADVVQHPARPAEVGDRGGDHGAPILDRPLLPGAGGDLGSGEEAHPGEEPGTRQAHRGQRPA